MRSPAHESADYDSYLDSLNSPPSEPSDEEQRIPAVRHSRAEIAAAESEIRASYVALYGTEPGLVWTRECAWQLLTERAAVKP